MHFLQYMCIRTWEHCQSNNITKHVDTGERWPHTTSDGWVISLKWGRYRQDGHKLVCGVMRYLSSFVDRGSHRLSIYLPDEIYDSITVTVELSNCPRVYCHWLWLHRECYRTEVTMIIIYTIHVYCCKTQSHTYNVITGAHPHVALYPVSWQEERAWYPLFAHACNYWPPTMQSCRGVWKNDILKMSGRVLQRNNYTVA